MPRSAPRRQASIGFDTVDDATVGAIAPPGEIARASVTWPTDDGSADWQPARATRRSPSCRVISPSTLPPPRAAPGGTTTTPFHAAPDAGSAATARSPATHCAAAPAVLGFALATV